MGLAPRRLDALHVSGSLATASLLAWDKRQQVKGKIDSELSENAAVKTFVSCYRSIQTDYRQTFFLGESNFQLQIQNRAARRINCNYRNRSEECLQKTLIADTDSLLNLN